MKSGMLFLVILSLSVTQLGTPVEAQEVETTLDVPVMSKYVWRGVVCNDEMVLQPSLDVSRKGFGINIWTNLDLTDTNDNDKEFNEIDLTVYYTRPHKKFETTVGYLNYTFPNTGGEATSEFFASIVMDMPGSPSLTYYLDTEEIEGGYLSIGASHSIPMGTDSAYPWSMDLAGAIGYGSEGHNSGYFTIAEAGLVDLALSAAAPIEVNDTLSITPQIYYMMVMKDSLKDIVGDDDTVLYFGLSAAWSY